ncbi:hypothetical protein [Mastigocladopsis repens]|nr:hypothetical protein [Mastigocladopsis repens]
MTISISLVDPLQHRRHIARAEGNSHAALAAPRDNSWHTSGSTIHNPKSL